MYRRTRCARGPRNSVYFLAANGTTSSVYALNATDGSKGWTSALMPGSTPLSVAVAGNVVFALTWGGQFAAFRAADGVELWHVATNTAVEGAVPSSNGTVCARSPLTAYNASDGKQRWQDAAGGGLAVAQGIVYAAGGGEIDAYCGSDGVLMWSRPLDSAQINGRPIVADGTVCAPSYGDVYALTADDGTVRWQYHIQPHGCPCARSLSAGGGQVYAAEWICVVTLRATDGALVRSAATSRLVVSTLYANGAV